jgi:serine/threonine protein kinase/tetratricopeptide (TPR) repeat protein
MPDGDRPRDADTDRTKHLRDSETVFGQVDDVLGTPPNSADGHSRQRGVANFHEFSRLLVEVGLITDEELASFAADSTEGVLGLSRALVKAGKLTPYQAAAVYQKKSRGLLIGNYMILAKLGQGGMGVVFKARHRRLGRVGALKILPPSFARDRTAVLRFRREIEAAGRLKHPNVVAAVDADEDRGVHFLVMDYVEGRDLDGVVRERGPLPAALAIDYLIQAARGLEAAHAQGIVHRDIKPANLMLDTEGTVRVLDLGLARLVDAANPYGHAAGGRLTESGMYMGTVDYMAPEQAEDSRRADHRADIYSLGCTLHYLLTGREPFDGETVLKRLMAHMERPAPSLRASRPEISATLDAAFHKMMAKRPADRPASMNEVIALLESCRTEAATPPTAPGAATKTRPLLVFDETPLKRATPANANREPSVLLRREEPKGLHFNDDLSLEDLVMDVRSEARPPAAARPARPPAANAPAIKIRPRKSQYRAKKTVVLLSLGAIALAGASLAALALFSGERETKGSAGVSPESSEIATSIPVTRRFIQESSAVSQTPVDEEFHTIFDGTSGNGWMLCDIHKRPVPAANIQRDGLNPNKSGSYLVVYDDKLGDFELDFDYKLSKGCNSGVFLRVSDLTDPIHSGIEVALDDKIGIDTGMHNTGAFFDLVAPKEITQKPAGQRNHMTITAIRSRISVAINGTEVSTIDLDQWIEPGKRPDGSSHKFDKVAIGKLPRTGYVGFQNQNTDCWFSQIRARKLSATSAWPSRTVAGASAAPPKPIATAEPKTGEDALPEITKALSARPKDARLLIERGRLLAELGRVSEADADFARAAELAPDELQQFLTAGWWVAGPYPNNLSTPAQSESAPAADPSTGPPPAGAEARHWQRAPIGDGGRVDLRAIFGADDITAYAMTIVYSITQRDVALVIGSDDAARIWHDGRLLFDSPVFSAPGAHVIIDTITPGRNSFVAKVANFKQDHSLNVVISERPADLARGFANSRKWEQAALAYHRAVASNPGERDPKLLEAGGQALFALERFKEAAPIWERLAALDSGNWDKQFRVELCYLGLHDVAACRRVCEAALKTFGKTQNLAVANNVVWQAALIPDAVRDFSALLDLGRKLADKVETGGNNYNTYGAILYRARRYKSAVTFLQKSIDAKKGIGTAYDWVFIAMARHNSRHPDAQQALERARTLAKDPSGPGTPVEIRALLAEAEEELKLPPPP